jgi:hypothetical protein
MNGAKLLGIAGIAGGAIGIVALLNAQRKPEPVQQQPNDGSQYRQQFLEARALYDWLRLAYPKAVSDDWRWFRGNPDYNTTPPGYGSTYYGR